MSVAPLSYSLSNFQSLFPKSMSFDQPSAMKSTTSRRTRNTSSHYTQYEMAVLCPITQRSWVIRKRFSDFFRFRQQLRCLASMITPHPDQSITLDMVQSILCLPFPRKHNFRRFDRQVVTERANAFRNIIMQAMICRTAAVLYAQKCGKFVKCSSMPSALEPFTIVVQNFLNVPPHLKTTHLVEATHDASCSICLSEFEENEWHTACHIVQLPCHHLFHSNCVVEWLHLHQTCPLCRAPSTTMSGIYVAP
ncbi:hypothetical protein THRCLA_01315 [Thraustotheca clavata]|uniref:RING-type domain-containing protein n=1 Tax=Thraustotheca clavata TaxID=74557 RepID=A0A1W0A8N8_9STRA|nr:hypothetical protein THRCLA_01315 [Thraustotheca clavata]